MKDLTLSQQYAILALDGQEILHSSMSKSAVVRGIAAAKVLEECADSELVVKINEAVETAKSLKKKEAKRIENEMASMLKTDGLLDDVPDILGCDMDYYTSGVKLRAYRSDEQTYLRLKETLRAEILEDGDITMECAVLLWLLRESGCIHELFSVSEQNEVQVRMTELASKNESFRMLWQSEFHNAAESFSIRYLRAKRNLFKNPYMEGVNLIFPYLERRNSIFIDLVILNTNVKERRLAVMEHLMEAGHYVEDVKVGEETLLKVDNICYRLFPRAKRVHSVPVQGVALVPVYW